MPSIFDPPEPTPPPSSADPAQVADGRVRIGETERADAMASLSRQFSAGRLTVDEFSQRSAVVARALTRAELGQVFADLPVGSLEDRLRAEAEAQDQRDALSVSQARQSQQQSEHRAAIANRLLHELVVQTREIVVRQHYPRGLEIVSVKCGVPGTMTVRPVRVTTGRIVTLTCSKSPLQHTGTNWAISDNAELLTFQIGSASFPRGWPSASFPISGSGKNLLGDEKRNRAGRTVMASVQAAVERAGCVAPVAKLERVFAHGEPQQKNLGYGDGWAYYPVFYLDDAGKLVYGTDKSAVDAEEKMASVLL